MEIVDILKRLDKLKEELVGLRPFSNENQRKLEEKYRLEWNFHSNHMEGNTLTYGETKMLLFFDKAVGNHEKRNYDEMEAHDVAINMVQQWAMEKEREVTAADLRNLNKVILVKPFYKDAITPEGGPGRKKIVPGEYKSTPNSVLLKSGKIHHYASPEETPSKMDELFQIYHDLKNEHPVLRAALTHHAFTAIHPFDDGNGRVGRLWANYILLAAGFPPLVVRTQNKEKYLTALQQADTGDTGPLVLFLANELGWSLELSIKAGRGEDIEEEDDFDKRISLLERRVEGLDVEEAKLKKDVDVVVSLFSGLLTPLYNEINGLNARKFRKFFNNIHVNLYIERTALDKIGEFEKVIRENNHVRELSLSVSYDGFKKAGEYAFNVQQFLNITLEDWRYVITLDQPDQIIYSSLYHQNISPEIIETIVKSFSKEVLNIIENQMKYIESKKKQGEG